MATKPEGRADAQTQVQSTAALAEGGLGFGSQRPCRAVHGEPMLSSDFHACAHTLNI